jgi:tight adherence protein B
VEVIEVQALPVAIAALAVVTVGALVAAYGAAYGRQKARFTAARGGQPGGSDASRSAAATAQRRDRAPSVTRLLGRSDVRHRLQPEILRAGWLLRPSEFIAISALVAMGCGAVVALLSRSLVMALAGITIGACIPPVVMSSRQKQRDRALSRQLPDALDMIIAALRAGASLSAGLEVVEAQMHPPISQEIGHALDEVRFGISHATALRHIVERTGNYDIELVVIAMLTQIQMGGNLTEILGNIAQVIRERTKLEGEISAATAGGKMSASILAVLPFAIAFFIQVSNPVYLRPLYTTQLGIMLAAVSAILAVSGTYLMRRISTVDI